MWMTKSVVTEQPSFVSCRIGGTTTFKNAKFPSEKRPLSVDVERKGSYSTSLTDRKRFVCLSMHSLVRNATFPDGAVGNVVRRDDQGLQSTHGWTTRSHDFACVSCRNEWHVDSDVIDYPFKCKIVIRRFASRYYYIRQQSHNKPYDVKLILQKHTIRLGTLYIYTRCHVTGSIETPFRSFRHQR